MNKFAKSAFDTMCDDVTRDVAELKKIAEDLCKDGTTYRAEKAIASDVTRQIFLISQKVNMLYEIHGADEFLDER